MLVVVFGKQQLQINFIHGIETEPVFGYVT